MSTMHYSHVLSNAVTNRLQEVYNSHGMAGRWRPSCTAWTSSPGEQLSPSAHVWPRTVHVCVRTHLFQTWRCPLPHMSGLRLSMCVSLHKHGVVLQQE